VSLRRNDVMHMFQERDPVCGTVTHPLAFRRTVFTYWALGLLL